MGGFGLLVLAAVIGTTIWVGVDAPKREWPNGSAHTSTWVLGCILLWIVVFPIYLVKRSKTIPVGATVAALPQAAAYRECPHCKEQMRRDASVCPHCRNESPAWRWFEGHWWFRADEHTPWKWLDEQRNSWVEHEPDAGTGTERIPALPQDDAVPVLSAVIPPLPQHDRP